MKEINKKYYKILNLDEKEIDYDGIIINYIKKLNKYYKTKNEIFENVNNLNKLNNAFYQIYTKLIYKPQENIINTDELNNIIDTIQEKQENEEDLYGYEFIIYIAHLINERYKKMQLEDFVNPFVNGVVFNGMIVYEFETKGIDKIKTKG